MAQYDESFSPYFVIKNESTSADKILIITYNSFSKYFLLLLYSLFHCLGLLIKLCDMEAGSHNVITLIVD